jgi:bifunctional non-homologous end joining protein LigD
VARKKAEPAMAATVRVTHPERVVDPSTGATKQDVVDYYLAAARMILPHLSHRPVALTRAPSGIGGQLFFQKHAESLKIPALTKLDPAFDPAHPPMVEVDSFVALMGAAQMNVIEFHTWNSLSTDIDRPDRMTFDLDPGEGVAWSQMIEAAELTRALLVELGLPSFVKTSGGKGLHVVVPIAPSFDWDTVKAFSKAIVEHLATVVPARFVAKSGPRNRVGKIFIDYLRNGRGATTACAFSLRARPGLGVSVPCGWEELSGLTAGDQWNLRNAAERLELDIDPWTGYGKKPPSLATAMEKLGFDAGRVSV